MVQKHASYLVQGGDGCYYLFKLNAAALPSISSVHPKDNDTILSSHLSNLPYRNLSIDMNTSLASQPSAIITTEISVTSEFTLRVKCWNIDGAFALKMSCRDFRTELLSFHINLFQETHLRPTLEDTVDLPDGYKIFAQSRRPKEGFQDQWGGVAAVVCDSLPIIHRRDLSSADSMVLQLDDLIIFNTYILPENRDWSLDIERDPVIALATALASASQSHTTRVLVMGDLNARTCSERAFPTDPLRVSKDVKPVSARGRRLLNIFADSNVAILNGQMLNGQLKYGPDSGNLTSFQPRGNSTIDYAAYSNAHLDQIEHFKICPKVNRYDHCATVVHTRMRIPTNRKTTMTLKRRKQEVTLPTETYLDKLLIETLQSATDECRKVVHLFGKVYHTTTTIKVAIQGLCRNAGKATATACAGAYWGANSRNNSTARVPGLQTNARAEVFAIIWALQNADPSHSLEISTRSEYAIRAAKYYVKQNEAQGWRCTNGDLLKCLNSLIKMRTAPLHLRHVLKDARNTHIKSAYQMAQQGCDTLPRVYTNLTGLNDLMDKASSSPPESLEAIDCEKVSTNLTDSSIQNPDAIPDRPPYPFGHRGRDKIRTIKRQNKRRLVFAPNSGAFWKEVDRLDNPRQLPQSVDSQQLKGVFKPRLNPQDPLPEDFDRDQYQLNIALYSLMPESTEDTTRERYFSSPWSEDNIGWAKSLIVERLKCAQGSDAKTNLDAMEIANDDFAFLCNECIRTQDCPSIWMRTTIIGILKKNKPAENPESYRVIALESCILKVLTLLIHKRFTDYCTTYDLLPDYQNGFRPGYRTNNNPFVLRCAIERAKASKQTLYTAFIDLTNAFPSTDHPTLWLKLRKLGIGGAIFDWIRKLYRRMEYYVRHGDTESESFHALMGLLTGDPSSPILWNLFLADLSLNPDANDLILAGVAISLMAQADDMIFLTTKPRSLQDKLNTFRLWCARNFLLLNKIKTLIMIWGSMPNPPPQFYWGLQLLAIATRETYVGVTVQSGPGNMFKFLYSEKASKARFCGHRILGLEDKTGHLTPKELKPLYLARVDPHLIYACEVSPDANNVHVDLLENVQVSFLRYMLGLHDRSPKVPLYTETGIMPLRPRRAILTLSYLIYVLQQKPTHYARAALEDSCQLALNKKPSWALDLLTAIKKLPFTCPELDLQQLSVDGVTSLRKHIETQTGKWLQNEVDGSRKLYLIHGRLEPQKNKPPAQKSLYLRHYLTTVQSRKHRRALTSVLLSTHHLAVQRMGWGDHEHKRVEDIRLRKCRFCHHEVETSEHALFQCAGSVDVRKLRKAFLTQIFHEIPHLQRMRGSTTLDFLKALTYERQTISLLAKYAYDVLQLFYAVPMKWPAESER